MFLADQSLETDQEGEVSTELACPRSDVHDASTAQHQGFRELVGMLEENRREHRDLLPRLQSED